MDYKVLRKPMGDKVAHVDEFLVVHTGLHEIDLPGDPLQIADIVSPPIHFRDLMIQAGVDPRGKKHTRVSAATILSKEDVHQLLPFSPGTEVGCGCLLEPTVIAEFGTSLLLSIPGGVRYLRWISTELAFVLFVVLRMCLACSGNRSGGAFSALPFSFSWVRFTTGYAASFFKLFQLPSFVEAVATSVHVAFLPWFLGESNVS